MWKSPGKDVKRIATIAYTITGIVSFIPLLYACSLFIPNLFLTIVVALPASIFIPYIIWLPIYAIGHLLCKIDEIAESVKNIEANTYKEE